MLQKKYSTVSEEKCGDVVLYGAALSSDYCELGIVTFESEFKVSYW